MALNTNNNNLIPNQTNANNGVLPSTTTVQQQAVNPAKPIASNNPVNMSAANNAKQVQDGSIPTNQYTDNSVDSVFKGQNGSLIQNPLSTAQDMAGFISGLGNKFNSGGSAVVSPLTNLPNWLGNKVGNGIYDAIGNGASNVVDVASAYANDPSNFLKNIINSPNNSWNQQPVAKVNPLPNTVPNPKANNGPLGNAAAKFTYTPANINTQPQTAPDVNTNFDPNAIIKSIMQARMMGGNTDLSQVDNTFNQMQGQNQNQATDLEAQRQALMAKLGAGEGNLQNYINAYKNSGLMSDLLANKFLASNQASNNKIMQQALNTILQQSLNNNQTAQEKLNSQLLGYKDQAANQDSAFAQSLASVLPASQSKAALDQLNNQLTLNQKQYEYNNAPSNQATSMQNQYRQAYSNILNQVMQLNPNDANYAQQRGYLMAQAGMIAPLAGIQGENPDTQVIKSPIYATQADVDAGRATVPGQTLGYSNTVVHNTGRILPNGMPEQITNNVGGNQNQINYQDLYNKAKAGNDKATADKLKTYAASQGVALKD